MISTHSLSRPVNAHALHTQGDQTNDSRGVGTLLRDDPGTTVSVQKQLIAVLTYMDARILEGVAMGMTTAQLAAELYLSHQGIAYHIGTMMRKFEVPNRTALASKAFSAGIFRIGHWPPRVLPDYINE
jgi:DNA-binding NarL/FixJ family response regulator